MDDKKLVALAGFLSIAILILSPHITLSSPERTTIVENEWDFTMLVLILAVLVLILYKGETTLENLKKMNERRLKRKRIKRERKRIKKLLKS